MQSIRVKHEVQMGHRLPSLPGKCQNLHGHTWTVILTITGKVDENGILIDYHEVKREWRDYLDVNFDHRFAMYIHDPLLKALNGTAKDRCEVYPGVATLACEPTVENLSRIFGEKAKEMFGRNSRTFAIELWEGNVNCATWESA